MIKRLRHAMELSQEQLAERTRLSLRTIQRVEAGHRVSYASLRALAEVFDFDVDALEWELYAMKIQSNEFTEAPLWARLLLRRTWYSTNRKWSAILEKVFATIFLLCFLIYLSPLFDGAHLESSPVLPFEFQIFSTGCAFLMAAYLMSLEIRLGDYFGAWTQWDSTDSDRKR